MSFLKHDSPMGAKIVNRFSQEIENDWNTFLRNVDSSPRLALPAAGLSRVVVGSVKKGDLLFHTLGGRVVSAGVMELYGRMGDIVYRSNAGFPTIGRQSVTDPEATFLRITASMDGDSGFVGPGRSRCSLDDLNDHLMEALDVENQANGRDGICAHVLIFPEFVLALRDIDYRVTRIMTHIEAGKSVVEVDVWDGRVLLTITLFCGKVINSYWDLYDRYDKALAARPKPEQENA